MFKKEIAMFKDRVREATLYFFGIEPEGLDDEIKMLNDKSSGFLSLAELSAADKLSREMKEVVLKYQTLCYFSMVFKKLLEIEMMCK